MASEKKSSPDTAKTAGADGASGAERPVRRTFPGPRAAAARLRVAVERSAYAELVAHAKSSLKAEVCGVLAGHVCADDEGIFVGVEAVIPGVAAGEGSVHVTFTQETWNAIHASLERDHPRLKIVGWYHTHPGFGVEFSDMDLFIQRNFFAGPAHLALVMDPLNGDVAICMNTPEGIQYLDRFWVDGREQQCRVPAPAAAKSGEAPIAASPDRLRALEERVSQLVQAFDEARNFNYRFMMTCGTLFCLALLAVAGYSIYSQWGSRLEPPRVNQIVPVPVQIGDKTVILGVGITSWQVPPELDAILLQAEILQREAAAKQAAATNSAGSTAPQAPQPKSRL
jgi:proteasome lid subunit RPN8/RPN11